MPEDLTGRRLGHYRIDGVISRGGMSVLYRATDVRLGRKVALKVIGEALAACRAPLSGARAALTAPVRRGSPARPDPPAWPQPPLQPGPYPPPGCRAGPSQPPMRIRDPLPVL